MRVSVRYSAVLVWTILLAASVLAGQSNNQFLQTKWTTDNGLPQNSVSAIAQTPDGYLWIGTFGGLARFDGVKFKIYTTANTPELKNNRIWALAADHAGRLWIGTENGQIIRYDENRFEMIDDGRRINNVPITGLFVDSDDLLWAGNRTRPLVCRSDYCDLSDFEGGATGILRDSDGVRWFQIQHNLYRFEAGRFILQEDLSKDLTAVEPRPKGGLWIVKEKEIGVYRDGRYKTLGKLKTASKNAATFVKPDGTFLVNVNKYFYEVTEDRFEISEIENVEGMTTHKVFVDREGVIWIGRVGEGLIRLINRRVRTLTKADGLREIAVNSIAEDRTGSVWLATNSGLFRWRDGETALVSPPSENRLLRGPLLVDHEGTLWHVSSKGVESIRDGKFGERTGFDWDELVSANSLFEDSRNNLWFGSDGDGVIVWDREKKIAHYTTSDGLAGNTADFITETRDGSIWIATRTGVSCLKDGKFTSYTTRDGLSNDYVRDIHEDPDGTLWFGTYGGGLNRFRDGQFKSITSGDGLFEDIVSRILVDDDDNFWFLGNRGIYTAPRRMLDDFADGKIPEVYCTAFTTADGMVTSEGNGGYQWAGTRTHDGRLWFPMIRGVVIIDPKQEKLPPPKPLIEEIYLNGKRTDAAGKVEIRPGNENLVINYTGLGFRRPEQIRFRYRLAGLDDEWTDAGTRRLANYPYLPSGNYRFQLSAANADGVWSEETAEIEIVVFPPFWKTWWFTLLLAVVLALVLYGGYAYRSRQFARERAMREDFARRLLGAQEAERKRIASEIHDNLGQQLLIIKNWAGYCLDKVSRASRIREQLGQIDETAAHALRDVRAMAKNLSPHHLDKVGLTNTIRYLIKQIADSGEIEFRTEIADVDGVLPKEAEINLYRIVQEAAANILKHSGARSALVSLKREAGLLRLVVSDDGVGFQPSESDYHEPGIGLNGITERAKMLGGSLTIRSGAKKGTQIILEIRL
ncbi:MAG: hypothetical protein JSS81_11605 [Acidobacteria bacterium]|nr:hypothetical protein [Acidobacteriota bacterium]